MHEPRFPVYRFGFRVVTPLFLGGAAPNQHAELRPASIKGVLRDWYRVLVGVEAAARNEGRAFGATAPDTGQSPFLLAIDRPLEGEERWNPPRAGRDAISGLNYLGYSLNLGQNDRKAIPAGRELKLEAAFPRGASAEVRRPLLGCLWLLAHLGGLGSRSRRGFGSLALEAWRGPDENADLSSLPLLRQAVDGAAAAERLALGLRALEGWFGSAGEPPAGEGRLPGYRLAGARFLVARGPNRAGAWDDALEALEHVGAEMQRFRRQSDIDGFPTAQILNRGELPPKAPARTAFGLPLRYRARGRAHTFEPYLLRPQQEARRGGRTPRGDTQEYHRFPSPLLIHIQQIQQGFLPIVTLLGGARPGRDLPVHVQRRSCPEDPENALLEEFLGRLAEAGADEVRR